MFPASMQEWISSASGTADDEAADGEALPSSTCTHGGVSTTHEA